MSDIMRRLNWLTRAEGTKTVAPLPYPIAGIAFVGPLRSGKTTLCNALESVGHATRYGFKDALIEEVAHACSSTYEEYLQYKAEMYDSEKKQQWRTMQQWWGTEFRRNRFDKNYWVKQLVDKVTKHEGKSIPVVDDCRFPNEYLALATLGFVFVRCLPNPTDVEVVASHESEMYWNTFEVHRELAWVPVESRIAEILDYVIYARTHRIHRVS